MKVDQHLARRQLQGYYNCFCSLPRPDGLQEKDHYNLKYDVYHRVKKHDHRDTLVRIEVWHTQKNKRCIVIVDEESSSVGVFVERERE